ncbi:MAG: phage tail assembly protein [Pseudomonadota bacterium]
MVEEQQSGEPSAENPNKITLTTPITEGGVEIREITLREPKAGELRGLQITLLGQGDVGSLIKLIPRISTPYVSETAVAEMSAHDIAQLGSLVLLFLQPSLRAQMPGG